MGKTRKFFKKIRDTKENFYSKMDTIKDKNSKDIIEAEDIKKRWQENTKNYTKKELNDPNNHNDVITHLESGTLE